MKLLISETANSASGSQSRKEHFEKRRTLARYCYEPACGGGGGRGLFPRGTKSKRRDFIKPLSPYFQEPNCGGGGGKGGQAKPISTEEELNPHPLPSYWHEPCCGGGGGREEDVQVSLYEVIHKITIPRRLVAVTVLVRFAKPTSQDWTQDTGLPEEILKKPRVTNEVGKGIPFEILRPTSAAIKINLSGSQTKNFRIDYGIDFDHFFDNPSRLNNRTFFEYNDVFWCDTTANTFRITYNFPSYLRLDNMKPYPVCLHGGNEISWEINDYPANQKLKLAIKGLMGSK